MLISTLSKRSGQTSRPAEAPTLAGTAIGTGKVHNTNTKALLRSDSGFENYDSFVSGRSNDLLR